MPQYIKKEGEVIYLLEYQTEKPEKPDIENCQTRKDDACNVRFACCHSEYLHALELWHKSAVKTPFHDSQKSDIICFVLSTGKEWTENKVESALSEGILIPDGLCEKKPMYLDYTFLDDGEYSQFPPDNESIPKYFAFIKSKPVEETNEAEQENNIRELIRDITGMELPQDWEPIKKSKSKFTITRK